MKIPVLGLDPSMRNWGMAAGILDLDTGLLTDLQLSLVHSEKNSGKQVRVNSQDLHTATELAAAAIAAAKQAKVVFVEVPVGSQSAAGMKSYGICIGVLGAIQAAGTRLVEVTPAEVKLAMAGNKNATKAQMIQAAMGYYPEANWPYHGKSVSSTKAEHMADAIGSIHAGVQTPLFQNIMKLLKEI